MIKKSRRKLVQFYFFSDVLTIAAGFFLTFWLRFHSGLLGAPKGIPAFQKYLLVLAFCMFFQVVYFASRGFYRIRLRQNRLDDLFATLANTLVCAVVTLLVFSYLNSYDFTGFEISHVFLALYVPVITAAIFLGRLAIFRFFRNVFMRRNGVSRILIAGDCELGRLMAEKLGNYTHFGIEVVGFLGDGEGSDILGGYDRLEKVVKNHQVTDLFIALPLSRIQTIESLIRRANNLLLDIRLIPDILQIASLKAGMEHIEGIPTINLGDIPLQGWRLFVKRGFDLAASFCGLVLLSPLFLIIALWVKLDSRGPVFYAQTRVGLDGRNFRMFKFRTMVQDAEKSTGAVWSPPDDDRITRAGRVMRRYSLDEWPQLLNVLKGDMSLVGPRPERPEFVMEFRDNIPRYMLRHRVRTGMTGWAQVHGLRGNTPLDQRIEFDIYYIQNYTFRLDLEILWRTVLKFKFIDAANR
ncbi:MAG TPA: undecaprenyl-phosphate glucose phosphotransferase [Candidatus Aminicenantes bacterium]|nr:undecaprenyl-phosphate glucose phosphotransferase [Candidatus Aminicenantes bacterium]